MHPVPVHLVHRARYPGNPPVNPLWLNWLFQITQIATRTWAFIHVPIAIRASKFCIAACEFVIQTHMRFPTKYPWKSINQALRAWLEDLCSEFCIVHLRAKYKLFEYTSKIPYGLSPPWDTDKVPISISKGINSSFSYLLQLLTSR